MPKNDCTDGTVSVCACAQRFSAQISAHLCSGCLQVNEYGGYRVHRYMRPCATSLSVQHTPYVVGVLAQAAQARCTTEGESR